MERNHTCEAAIVSCIDFRFQRFIREWAFENLEDRPHDYIALAGATKNLDTIKEQVDISARLHQIKNLYLTHHENCGAYGDESTLERHSQDLKKAREEISDKHPNLQIHLYYLHLDGTFQKIE